MWTGEVPFSDLTTRGRWKVEFFQAEPTVRRGAAYESVALGEVFAERREFLDPREHGDWTFNHLGLENVAPLVGDVVNFEPRRGREVRSRSKVFRLGDVLYGRLRPNLNKVLLVDEELGEGICSGEFYVLIPDGSRVLSRFARWLLASRYVQDVAAGLITGSALPRLQADDLLAIEAPLPPLDDQRAFEALIVREDERRRRLAREAAAAPRRLMDAIEQALRAGEPPAGALGDGLESGPRVHANPLPPPARDARPSRAGPSGGKTMRGVLGSGR